MRVQCFGGKKDGEVIDASNEGYSIYFRLPGGRLEEYVWQRVVVGGIQYHILLWRYASPRAFHDRFRAVQVLLGVLCSTA